MNLDKNLTNLVNINHKKIIKIFNILKKEDFKHDNFLQYFYNNYTKYNKNIIDERKRYEEYLDIKSNKKYKHDENINLLFTKLHKEFSQNTYKIKKELSLYEYFILSINDNKDIILQELYNSIYEKNRKLTKKHILNSISISIQQTLIKNEIVEDENSLYLEMQESMKNEMKEVGIVLNRIINYDLIRQEEIRNIYNDTELKCKKMMNENQLKAKLYNLNVYEIHKNDPYENIIITNNMDTKKFILQEKIFKPNVKLYNDNYLNYHYNNSIHILAGSKFKTGGMCDQGYEINETNLYLSSSIIINDEQIINKYPLNENIFIHYPKVLIFKDYNDKKYSLLDKNNIKIISILNSSSDNITNLKDKLINTFKLCSYLNYETIIFDDWGCQDFNISPYCISEIFKEVINLYGNYFRQIVFGIKNKDIYNIFNLNLV